MSNRFKFRIWDKNSKLMRYHSDGWNESVDVLEEVWEHLANYKYEINQFTSLKDKNNKDIYEGDIVKRFDGIECFVCFDRGCFCLRVLLDPHKCCCLKDIEKPQMLEVICNIYENPDKLTDFAKSFL